ncbi:putative Ig domain-containing protein [Stigmatella sp. ncwal1]|uniref:Ig domain-containing protein n=1 Tax=Stigmatella ashevillensis TaxID=2995309 RepID=A0ABT5DBF2_9BACT|nr:putative Ig domain-containing protein [Stigmatella ashevillena]MDC0710133.1 putative Ig domain-containing protein [Stigmatella ashevillena]
MNARWRFQGLLLLCGLGGMACLFDPNFARFEKCGANNTCNSGYSCFQEEGVCLPDCGFQDRCPGDEPPPNVPPDAGQNEDGGTDAGTDAGVDGGTDAGPPTVKPLIWITRTLPLATEEVPYAQRLYVEGGTPPYSFTAVGSLPRNFGISGAFLQGNPADVGSSGVAIRVTDSATPPSSTQEEFTLEVRPLLRLAGPGVLAHGYTSTAYTERISATGGTPPYKFTMDQGSVLPPNLSLGSDGTLTGTPTAATGQKSYWVRVTDSGTPPQTVPRNLLLELKLQQILTAEIANQSVPDGRVGTEYNYTFKISNGVTPTWTLKNNGPLPAGMTFDAATATLKGTPSQKTTVTFTIVASGLLSLDKSFTVTIH